MRLGHSLACGAPCVQVGGDVRCRDEILGSHIGQALLQIAHQFRVGEHLDRLAEPSYASLGVRLDYDPTTRRIKATADLSRVAGRVRGGT